MNLTTSHHAVPPSESSRYLIPLALICLLPLFPPETRGESMAGASALIALFAVLGWKRCPGLARVAPLAVVGLVYFPAWLVALAPGGIVRPIAVLTLAAAAGIYTASLDRATRRRDLPALALALVAAAVALYAVYQTQWGLEAVVRAIEDGQPVADRQLVLERARDGRAFAAFPTPAALGGFLIVALPATVGAALERRGLERRLLLLLAGLQLLGLVAAASATAAAALLGALVAAAVVLRPDLRRRILLPVVAAGLVVAAVVTLRGSQITDFGAPGSPWRLRAGNFRIAGAMIADHPWAGVGPGGFGESYPGYRRAGENESQHAHNLPLELCAEWGLPAGTLLSLWIYAVLLGPLLRRRSGPAWEQGVAIGLAAAALQNLMDFTLLLPSILWIGAVLRGWIDDTPAGSAAPGGRWPAGLALASVAVASVLAGLSGLAWNDRVASRQTAASGEMDRAQELARRSTRLAPWNADGWLYRAELRAATGEPSRTTHQQVLQEVDRSIALSPIRPAARMFRARMRAARGDLPGALADATAAARLYPLRPEYAKARDELDRRLVSQHEGGQER